MIALKPYQQTAVAETVDLLVGGRPAPSAGTAARGPADRRCVLIEAPTGSGKTVMAGTVASRCGAAQRVLWFWFAPFAGVVGQAAAVLASQFADLRVRDVYHDRDVEDLRPGDVYVTTWGAVAARNAASRVVRSASESRAALDQVVEAARDRGFLVGAVIDEAHHGFVNAPVAKQFVREVLAPDLTILVTATPNDRDVEAFRREAGLAPVSRVSVSRADAVAAGLIKPGVRAVSFAPAPNAAGVRVDFARTAIRYGVDTHAAIKRALAAEGHDLTPLLLVQVESGEETVADARRALVDFGIPDASIAVHTADEPDPDVLAVAHDEGVQALIFKMAVALGFDAPRAWTLVSTRSSRDVDFGIQIVGRVLRVDRRLQGRPLPDALQYGYVFVADPDVQTGLVGAAEQINRLRTDIQRVAAATTTVLVQVGAENAAPARVAESEGSNRAAAYADAAAGGGSDQAVIVPAGGVVDLFGIGGAAPPTAPGNTDGPRTPAPLVRAVEHRYALRADLDLPRQFQRERFPQDDGKLAECVGDRIRFDRDALGTLQRQGVFVVRRDLDLFRRGEAGSDTLSQVRGDLDVRAVIREGQHALFEDDYVGGRSLLPVLVRRFEAECRTNGLLDWLDNAETLEQGVYRILGDNPALLRRALRECLARFVETVPAAPIPGAITSPVPLPESRLNVYGVVPPGLNTWEVEFAQMLDLDPTGVVRWWHRNEPRKPWSVSVCAPGATHDYYPDFVVGVRGRAQRDGVLLAETKFAYQTRASMAKVRADHKAYGPVLMLTRDDRAAWWTLAYDASRDKVVEDRPFSLGMLAGF